MPLEGKVFERIEEADLQGLVTNKIPEGKALDYKEAIPGNSDSEKKEFLADVSSFSNALGGYLILGIKEKSGVASEVTGVNTTNPDSDIGRLENILRDGIEPRIPGVAMRAVPLQNSKVALLICVPRSWALPHRVIYKGHDKFYSRHSSGKYSLDVPELRALFALSETTAERIRRFREERLSTVLVGETPIPVDTGPKTVLHIIPLGAFAPGARLDFASLPMDFAKLRPINASGWSPRHNFDGILTYTSPGDKGPVPTYVQLFRNGSIEAVESRLIRPHNDKKVLHMRFFEEQILEALPAYLSVQKDLGIQPPLLIMLSLLGLRGFTILTRSSFVDEHQSIEKENLLIPEILLDRFECDAGEVMKPAFDTIWNAAGYSRSGSYDSDGKWLKQ